MASEALDGHEAQPSNMFHAMDAFQTVGGDDRGEVGHLGRGRPSPPTRERERFASITPPGSYEATGAGGPTVQTKPPAQPPFDPQQEYRRLLDVVSVEDRQRELDRTRKSFAVPGGADQDPYQQLMSRERRVLDTVDRIVNDDVERRTKGSGLMGMSLAELCFRVVSALHGLFQDLVDAAADRSVPDALAALRNPHRMPFLGVALVATALLLAALRAL